MEERDLRKKIEMFFAAELSVEEECELCRYLRDNDVPAELFKDKETVLALCGDGMEISLPDGAGERLQEMLDSLCETENKVPSVHAGEVKRGRKIFRIPRYVWRSSVAAVIVFALVLAHYVDVGVSVADRGNENRQLACSSGYYEEDTFDNPEDALICARAVFGEVMHAMDIAHTNMKEIGNTLEMSVMAGYSRR